MNFTDIIDAQDLNDLIGKDQLVILDCRKEKTVEHIQGTQPVDFEKELTGTIIKGVTGRHPLPRIDEFAAQCGKWGINSTKQVVVYDDNSGAWASRLWWMLKWLGHENVAVLNGGWANWQLRNYAMTTGIIYPKTQTFEVNENRSWLAYRHNIQAVVKGNSSNLIDSRAAGRYRGEYEPIDPIAGHIPTAVNLPFTENIGEDGLWRSKEEIYNRQKPVFSNSEGVETIFYCGSGVTACHNILGSQYAGLPMPRLYVGSWSDWINTMEIV